MNDKMRLQIILLFGFFFFLGRSCDDLPEPTPDESVSVEQKNER